MAAFAVVAAVALTVPSASAEARPLASITEGVGDAAGREVGDGCKDARQANTTVSSPTRAGKAAIRHHVESCGERAEVTGPKTAIGGTYWEGWSMYLPSDFDPAGHYTIVNQWATWPSPRAGRFPCGGNGNKLSIRASGSLGFDLQRPGGGKDMECTKYPELATVAEMRGKWVDFVQQAKWTGKSDGFLRLWMRIGGGEYRKVVDHAGATWWDDEGKGPYFKIGAYLGDPGWKGRPTTVFTDEYRLAGADAVFADVAPGGDQAGGGGGPGSPGPQPSATTTAGPTPTGSAAPSGSASPAPSGSPSESPSESPTGSQPPTPSPGGGGDVQAGTGPGATAIDFDNGSYEPAKQEFHGNPFDIVANPAGSGKVARVTFKQEERNEIRLKSVKAGSEHCYSIDYYIPKGTRVEGIYTQWHELPDRDLGEDWRKPPVMVLMNDKITIHGYHSPNKVNDNGNSIKWPKGGDRDLGPVTRDTWMRFDYHIKWSYGSDGLIEVYRDNKKVLTYQGPNTYNDKAGNYWKIGIYDSRKPGGETRTVYYDNMVQGPAGQGCRNG